MPPPHVLSTADVTPASGQLPYLDQAVSALVDDLHDRGLDHDVLVVVWGKMGRTPRINRLAGRVPGGGFCMGQTIGRTNHFAEAPLDRPVHFFEILATRYRHLGIAPESLVFRDIAGRPVDPLDGYGPLHELTG